MSIKPLSRYDLSLFLLRFRQLAASGLPADQALEQIAVATPESGFRGFLQQATAALRNGAPLPEALCPLAGGHPFPPFLHNKMKVAAIGENGLVLALDTTSNYLDHCTGNDSTLTHLTKLGSFLPPVLFLFFFSLFVIPEFGKMYSDFAGSLPVPTQLILDVSDFIRRYFLLILPVLFWGALLFLKHQRKKIKMRDRAYIFSLLANLIAAGEPSSRALELAATATDSIQAHSCLELALSSTTNGQELASALQQAGLITPLASTMLLSATEQHSTSARLALLAAHYAKQTRHNLERDRFVEMVAAILFTIIILIVVVVCLYLPIFQLAGAVGG